MNALPTPPSAGDRISAKLIADILRAIRRITPIAGSGVKIKSTPNGATISTTKDVVQRHVAGCFDLGMDGDGDKALINRYYQIGGRVYELTVGSSTSDMLKVETYVMKGNPSDGNEYTAEDKPYIFLRVHMKSDDDHSLGDAEIDGVKNFDRLVEASNDLDVYIKPLYKLSHDGHVKIDFRNMPQIASYEISDEEELTA